MLSPEEIEILSGEEAKALIETHLEEDPSRVALKLSRSAIPGSLVAGQVKALKKAKKKLPTWYEKRCILPSRAYEQASSETTAKMKIDSLLEGGIKGRRLLDLTSGLGVDTVAFARLFDSVEAVEPNPSLNAAAQYNFPLLGVKNVQVHSLNAESFLEQYEGPPFDLVYLDPDRRNEAGKRLIRLEDYRPDVIALQDRLLEIGKSVLIKVSPMYDIGEGVRNLKKVRKVWVNSVDHEVRELLYLLDNEWEGLPEVEARMLRGGELHIFRTDWTQVRQKSGSPNSQEEPFVKDMAAPHQKLKSSAPPSQNDFLKDVIYEPDPALYKLGITRPYLNHALPDVHFWYPEENGYHYAIGVDYPFAGRIFVPGEILDYKPKKLKRWLKEKGISRANIYNRNFDIPTSQLLKALNLKEGGSENLLFSRDPDGSRWVAHVVRDQ